MKCARTPAAHAFSLCRAHAQRPTLGLEQVADQVVSSASGAPAFGLKNPNIADSAPLTRWSAHETIQFLICCSLSLGSGGNGGRFLVGFPAFFFAL